MADSSKMPPLPNSLYAFKDSKADEYLERQISCLTGVYKAAKKELDAILKSPASTGFAKWRAAEQLKQISTIITALNAEARNFARRVTPKAYELGTDITTDRLRNAGIFAEANFGNRVNTQAVSALSDQITLDLLQANGSLDLNVKRFILKTKQLILEDAEISRMVAQGVIKGDTRRDVSGRILSELEKGVDASGKIRIIGKDGVPRLYDPAKYAELVARTRTREVVTQGALNFGRANGVDLYQVSWHASSCPQCVPYQGKVYSATGGTEGFPLLENRPPFHPSCRHVLTAYVSIPGHESEMEALSKLSRGKIDITSRAEYDAALLKYGYAGRKKR